VQANEQSCLPCLNVACPLVSREANCPKSCLSAGQGNLESCLPDCKVIHLWQTDGQLFLTLVLLFQYSRLYFTITTIFSYTINFIVLFYFQNKFKKLHSQSAVLSNCPGNDDLICDICFDPVRKEQGHVTGRAMKSCDHWFCDTCWCCHLVERVLQGDLMLSCPVSELGFCCCCCISNPERD
jgi:hypothetical protein